MGSSPTIGIGLPSRCLRLAAVEKRLRLKSRRGPPRFSQGEDFRRYRPIVTYDEEAVEVTEANSQRITVGATAGGYKLSVAVGARKARWIAPLPVMLREATSHRFSSFRKGAASHVPRIRDAMVEVRT